MRDDVRTVQEIHKDQILNSLIGEIRTEIARARKKHPRPHASPHESYAILLEEVEEVWEAIRANDPAQARLEMVQVAACAIRYLIEVGEKVRT